MPRLVLTRKELQNLLHCFWSLLHNWPMSWVEQPSCVKSLVFIGVRTLGCIWIVTQSTRGQHNQCYVWLWELHLQPFLTRWLITNNQTWLTWSMTASSSMTASVLAVLLLPRRGECFAPHLPFRFWKGSATSEALKSMRNAVSWDENMHSWKFTRKYNAVIMIQIWSNDNCELVEQVKMLQIGVLSFQNECTMPSEMWRAADNWLKSNVSAPFVILDVSPVG